MRFAIKPYKNCPITDKVDELDLDVYYKPSEVFEYVKNHPSQTLVISQPSPLFTWSTFKLTNDWIEGYYPFIKENPDCVQIRFKIPYDEWEKMDYDLGYSFMFVEGCRTWGDVYKQLATGASDILIYGELGFDIVRLAEVVHTAGTRIRVIPDIAQASTKVPYSGIRKFFIRPEDIDLYTPYVDTLFLSIWNGELAPTYYEIYHLDKEWFGPLKEIIFGLDSKIDSRNISSLFGRKRLHCNQECLKGGKCDICGTVEEVSEMLSDNGLYLKTIKGN